MYLYRNLLKQSLAVGLIAFGLLLAFGEAGWLAANEVGNLTLWLVPILVVVGHYLLQSYWIDKEEKEMEDYFNDHHQDL